jgi:hypothetical protein
MAIPRYPQELSPGDVYLGFYEESDLYLCQQLAGLPPTIVARYGNDANAYSTFNPAVQGLAAMHVAPPCFTHAYARIMELKLIELAMFGRE